MTKKLLLFFAMLCAFAQEAWANWTGGTYTASGNETHSSLPTPNSPGVYMLRLIDGGNIKTQKIVIK